jgi:hypothetical protein
MMRRWLLAVGVLSIVVKRVRQDLRPQDLVGLRTEERQLLPVLLRRGEPGTLYRADYQQAAGQGCGRYWQELTAERGRKARRSAFNAQSW